MIFYLGTHMPTWLERTIKPFFVSRRRLVRCKRKLPRALGTWALDSGAFTELKDFGEWTVSPRDYAAEVRHWRDEIGGLQWASPQDWMCEPIVIEGGKIGKQTFKGTKLSVPAHQRLTVQNLVELRTIAPDLPWIPVLQGWSEADYLRCRDLYDVCGVDLTVEPLVGLGSVCRRQHTGMAEDLIRRLSADGIRLHGFGFKLNGLRRAGRYLASSDSMAWSFEARNSDPLPGCKHRNCANCYTYALWWRDKVIRAVKGSQVAEQGVLFP